MIKRIFDFLMSIFLIFLFSPLMILIMLLIKFFEDFEIFFIQKGQEKNGKKINVYKFQTIKNLRKNKNANFKTW